MMKLWLGVTNWREQLLFNFWLTTGILTRVVGVEGKHADHNTTTTGPKLMKVYAWLADIVTILGYCWKLILTNFLFGAASGFEKCHILNKHDCN